MKEKIITIPNIITLCRLILIPFFVISIIYNRVEFSILLFTGIALSDTLDGLSARIIKQKTKKGAIFDSLVDWLVLFSVLTLAVFKKEYISTKIAIALMVPAVIIFITKVIYIKKQKTKTPSIIGKVMVAFAYVTVIAILIEFKYKNIFLITTTILVYATTINYVRKDIGIF